MKPDKKNKKNSNGIVLKTIGGMEFVVDAADAPMVKTKKWSSYSSSGNKHYVRSSTGGIHLHHFIMGGVKPDEIIRFADKNPLNCRRSNLIISKRISNKTTGTVSHKVLKTSIANVLKNNEKISENFIKAGSLKEVTYGTISDLSGQFEFPGIRARTVFEAILETPNKKYSFGTWNNIVDAMKAYNNGVKGVNNMTKENHPLIPTSEIIKEQNKINNIKTDTN